MKILVGSRAELLFGVKNFYHCTDGEIVRQWKKAIELLEEHNDNTN